MVRKSTTIVKMVTHFSLPISGPVRISHVHRRRRLGAPRHVRVRRRLALLGFQGFQRYRWHLSTNHFEFLREIMGLRRFVVCLRAWHLSLLLQTFTHMYF